MKKTLLLCSLILATFGLSGCVSHHLNGGYTTDIQSIDFARTRFKMGSACANYLFGVIPLGGEDRFIQAVQNGRISRVQFTEDRTENYLILGRKCIDVYGQ